MIIRKFGLTEATSPSSEQGSVVPGTYEDNSLGAIKFPPRTAISFANSRADDTAMADPSASNASADATDGTTKVHS